MKSLVTKNEFIKLLKNKYPLGNILQNYEDLPETITIDRDEYKINNVVTIVDDKVESVELNYYCNTGYKFLFPYRIETNVLAAVNNLVGQYKNLN